MTNQSQIKFVEKELRKYKRISRNKCLAKYITRLGAIIKLLEEKGFVFDSIPSKSGKTMMNGRFIKTRYGEDYVYYLVSAPKEK